MYFSAEKVLVARKTTVAPPGRRSTRLTGTASDGDTSTPLPAAGRNHQDDPQDNNGDTSAPLPAEGRKRQDDLRDDDGDAAAPVPAAGRKRQDDPRDKGKREHSTSRHQSRDTHAAHTVAATNDGDGDARRQHPPPATTRKGGKPEHTVSHHIYHYTTTTMFLSKLKYFRLLLVVGSESVPLLLATDLALLHTPVLKVLLFLILYIYS